LRDSAPDLILLDIGLPDTSGIELLDKIKSLVSETMVIMMTATEETKMITKAHELGALDYLVKHRRPGAKGSHSKCLRKKRVKTCYPFFVVWLK
jgi:response regulator of citrate/malate metabolism